MTRITTAALLERIEKLEAEIASLKAGKAKAKPDTTIPADAQRFEDYAAASAAARALVALRKEAGGRFIAPQLKRCEEGFAVF